MACLLFLPPNHPTTQPLNKVVKQKQILDFCRISQNINDIMNHLGYKDSKNFRFKHIKPLIEEKLLSMTFPNNPNHQEQKYITTKKGTNL